MTQKSISGDIIISDQENQIKSANNFMRYGPIKNVIMHALIYSLSNCPIRVERFMNLSAILRGD